MIASSAKNHTTSRFGTITTLGIKRAISKRKKLNYSQKKRKKKYNAIIKTRQMERRKKKKKSKTLVVGIDMRQAEVLICADTSVEMGLTTTTARV
mgnify:CR=1 FL=1